MSKNRKSYLIPILIVAAIGLIAFAAIKKGKNFGKKPGIKVTVEEAKARTIVETVVASGKIYPEKEIKISSDVSGEIVALKVKEGDSVKAGQLLLKIDPDLYQTSIERAEATVNSSKAQLANSKAGVSQLIAQKKQMQVQLDNARKTYERTKQLYNEGILSLAELETTEGAYNTAKANMESGEASIESANQTVKAAEFTIKSAEASLKESRENLARTVIYAPESGIISRLNVEKGERVVGTLQMSGTEILRIADMSSMEVKVDVSENDVLRVSLKDEVDIDVDAYQDRLFKGSVKEIANSANDNGMGLNTDQITNFVVTIQIEPDSYKDLLQAGKRFPFRPGMSASVDIKTKLNEGALSVPIQAVTTRENEDENANKDDLNEIVFVQNADTVEARVVKTAIQDDEYIQIVDGLKSGESIVTGPYTAISKRLEKGTEVEVVTEEELNKKKSKKGSR